MQKQFTKTNSKELKKKPKKDKTMVKDRYFRFQTRVCQNVSNEVLLACIKFQVIRKFLPPFRFLRTKYLGALDIA